MSVLYISLFLTVVKWVILFEQKYNVELEKKSFVNERAA